jgi:hypothetical protein
MKGIKFPQHNKTDNITAIHPFCKYAPKNDRLSEQIYNKFNELSMIDSGTISTRKEDLPTAIYSGRSNLRVTVDLIIQSTIRGDRQI